MRSLRRSMCAAILSLEAVVMLLTTPVMISLGDVRWQVAVAVGGGLTVLCVLLAVSPCSAQSTRGAAASSTTWMLPRSNARHRRRPSPRS